MLDDVQKRTAEAIVNIFETGRILGDYANVTNVKGDAGRLTYGRSQTTLPSGNLFLLIKSYCAEPGAEFGPDLATYLPGLKARLDTLNDDARLQDLLHKAGSDPVMQSTQDDFFDRVYWDPAARSASTFGIATALGNATVYDSVVHGAWKTVRTKVIDAIGLPSAAGEKTWIETYIRFRRDWLASGYPLLRKTVYRMDALGALVKAGNWTLSLPVTVRGLFIDEARLAPHRTAIRASAQLVEERLLEFQMPHMQGQDVQELQSALSKLGPAVPVSGVFDEATAQAVVAYQRSAGLKPDGVVGPATRSALGLV